MTIFEPRFHFGQLITQDQTNLTKCNPEVDSMFLTTNTYYLIGDKTLWVGAYFDLEDRPRRWMRPGVRDGENGISRPYDNPNNMSRDNLMGMITYLGFTGKHDLVRKLAKQILFNGSRFANTHTTTGEKKKFPQGPDFAGPMVWSNLIRSTNLKVLYPLLWLCDLYTLVKVLITVFFGDPYKASTVYHTLTTLHWGTKSLPTLFSCLAYKAYVKLKKGPKEYANINDVSGVVGCLRYYSRFDFDPPIQTIAQKSLSSHN